MGYVMLCVYLAVCVGVLWYGFAGFDYAERMQDDMRNTRRNDERS